MRKRISCKVIRTIPLDTSVDELRYKSRSNNTSYNINNATSKSVIYTNRLKISRIPLNNGVRTSILNCYA